MADIETPHQVHLQASGKMAIRTGWGTLILRWPTSICPIRGTYRPQAKLQYQKKQFARIGCHTGMHCGHLHRPQPQTKYIDTIHNKHRAYLIIPPNSIKFKSIPNQAKSNSCGRRRHATIPVDKGRKHESNIGTKQMQCSCTHGSRPTPPPPPALVMADIETPHQGHLEASGKKSIETG